MISYTTANNKRFTAAAKIIGSISAALSGTIPEGPPQEGSSGKRSAG